MTAVLAGSTYHSPNLHASLDGNETIGFMPFTSPNEIEMDVRGKIGLIKDHAINERKLKDSVRCVSLMNSILIQLFKGSILCLRRLSWLPLHNGGTARGQDSVS